MELYKIRNRQGILSATDYWEQELEVDDLEKKVFDQKFSLSVAENNLSSLIGLKNDDMDIILKDTIPLIGLPERILFEDTLVYQIGNIQTQLNYLAIPVEMKNYTPTLVFDLSIKPQYPAMKPGSREFTESITRLWNSGSWIEYSGSIVFSFPISQAKQGQLKRSALMRDTEIGKLDLEGAKSTLKNEENELIQKIFYLKSKAVLLSEQLEYSLKRKSEKEKLFDIDVSSSLEIGIAGVDADSAKTELFSNNVEILLSILELHNLNDRSIYDLFF